MTEYVERVRANFPKQLLDLPIWLTYRLVVQITGEKPKKIPFYADGAARQGKLDSPEDRRRLVDFESATRALDGREGLGIALGEVPGEELCISGIDLDNLGPHPEEDERVREILAAAGSYCERSPSLKGLHVIGTGNVGTTKKDERGVEIYSGGRFFTVTGDAVNRAGLSDLTDGAQVARRLFAPDTPKPNGAGAAHKADGHGIVAGGRNNFLSREAFRLRKAGSTVEQIIIVLRAMNEAQCDPPLPDEEVLQIARGKERVEPKESEAPVIHLVSFTAEEIMQPIPPESFLLPGIPAEAYTLIAGALSSFKTTLLMHLLVWKATGYQFLGLDPEAIGCDPGVVALVSYEDIDRRIFSKLQRVVQHTHQLIESIHGRQDANVFLARAEKHIKRVTLVGRSTVGIITRDEGRIVPNEPLLEAFLRGVRAIANKDVTIGLDPLRLAIVGSQNDDDVAVVVVHTLNYLAAALPGSGVIVCSHMNKAGAQEPAEGYAGAAYATSGSALYSQHARSNFMMTRLKSKEIADSFDRADVSQKELERQSVVQLVHGRLSHGPESNTAFLVMREGVLLPLGRRSARTAATVANAGLPELAAAIERLHSAQVPVSQHALEQDEALRTAVGGRNGVRSLIGLVVQSGWLAFGGKSKDRVAGLTDEGRRRLNLAANTGEDRPESRE